MKTTLLSAAALALLALTVTGAGRPTPSAAAPQSPFPSAKDAEPLPDPPRIAADSKLTPLNPGKTFYLDVSADGKTKRVLFACEVCLREGPLEVFLCRKGTKEHEAIVRSDLDGQLIHAALNAAGAKEGSPTQFVNAKDEPDFKPATGDKIKVSVHYRMGGKLHTHPAQEWVWNAKAKKHLEHGWVFAGSKLLRDPDEPNRKPYYGANSGEFISLSNFPFSMLEIAADISRDDANLTYEAKTDRIPPLLSKVWVILEPAGR